MEPVWRRRDGRERERETQGERETDGERDRKGERETERQREKETERARGRQRQRETEDKPVRRGPALAHWAPRELRGPHLPQVRRTSARQGSMASKSLSAS